MAELAAHRAYLDAEMAELQAAPLSWRKAQLIARLVDTHVDRLFAAGGWGEDILEFRATLARHEPALGRILTLCAAAGGVRLTTEAVAVALADYGRLSVADFMVSLYNDHSVQRLLLIDADEARHDMLATLEEALPALDRMAAQPRPHGSALPAP